MIYAHHSQTYVFAALFQNEKATKTLSTREIRIYVLTVPWLVHDLSLYRTEVTVSIRYSVSL